MKGFFGKLKKKKSNKVTSSLEDILSLDIEKLICFEVDFEKTPLLWNPAVGVELYNNTPVPFHLRIAITKTINNPIETQRLFFFTEPKYADALLEHLKRYDIHCKERSIQYVNELSELMESKEKALRFSL